ncbi:sugar transporter SWEET1 [Folsomia candida]|uniref:Sugar transporter SWEET n=1 Tax=Folsomia candida TaxID=158441 RepID=A0A226EQP4_FOLCA|nr:sugar transporter SWEET1 [Folsomia candida]XP_035703958.1 sugar transporter SWEET1 [Folsomia candida]OXA59508.1 Sugar transporter SWEET1 [Folsomia candida]
MANGVNDDHFWKDLLGSTATFTTICQFLSGMFTVHRIVVKQGGSVGDLSPVPYLMGVVGCGVWLLYGHLRNDATVVNCNIVGTLLNVFYVLVFMKFNVIKTLIYRQVLCALVFLSLTLVYVHTWDSGALVHNGDSPLVQNIGLLCIVMGILGCASPLVSLKEVMRTKSTDMLPFPLILSMFLVCTQWWIYGILAKDPYMQFPNFMGTCIALLQLGLFCVYSSTSPNKGLNADYKKLHNVI